MNFLKSLEKSDEAKGKARKFVEDHPRGKSFKWGYIPADLVGPDFKSLVFESHFSRLVVRRRFRSEAGIEIIEIGRVV